MTNTAQTKTSTEKNQTDASNTQTQGETSKGVEPVSSNSLSDYAGNASQNPNDPTYVIPNKTVNPEDIKTLKDKKQTEQADKDKKDDKEPPSSK